MNFVLRFILPKEALVEKKEENATVSEETDSTTEPPNKKQKVTGKSLYSLTESE